MDFLDFIEFVDFEAVLDFVDFEAIFDFLDFWVILDFQDFWSIMDFMDVWVLLDFLVFKPYGFLEFHGFNSNSSCFDNRRFIAAIFATFQAPPIEQFT